MYIHTQYRERERDRRERGVRERRGRAKREREEREKRGRERKGERDRFQESVPCARLGPLYSVKKKKERGKINNLQMYVYVRYICPMLAGKLNSPSTN